MKRDFNRRKLQTEQDVVRRKSNLDSRNRVPGPKGCSFGIWKLKFGYFPFSWNQFWFPSAPHETISGKKRIFRKTPPKPKIYAVKSDYAPCYAVRWSKLCHPQNRERTANTGFRQSHWTIITVQHCLTLHAVRGLLINNVRNNKCFIKLVKATLISFILHTNAGYYEGYTP